MFIFLISLVFNFNSYISRSKLTRYTPYKPIIMDTLIRQLFSMQENIHFMTEHFLKDLGVKVNLPSIEDTVHQG